MITRHLKFYLLSLGIPLLLSLGLGRAVAQPYADAQDSLTLLRFQRAMMAEGWPALWDTSKNVFHWQGVSLNHNTGKVKDLSIRGDKLSPAFRTDSLPPAISILQDLDGLKDLGFVLLDLKYIPAEIGDFTGLDGLGLNYNQLETLPPEINRLSVLRYLFLNANHFSDLPDLSGLVSLTNLSLSSNPKLTALPNTVLSLRSLEKLDIGYTGITALPSGISALARLRVLRADAARLAALPGEIGQLRNLEELHLSNNQLAALPEAVGNLGKLRFLGLSRNRLRALPGSFSRLSSLRHIDFGHNRFERFPLPIANLQRLFYITAKGNGMEGAIPPGILRAGARVDLDDNNLKGKVPVGDRGVPDRLYVRNNRFTLKDISESFARFDPQRNLILEFQPQQRIGAPQTLRPAAGSSPSVSVDGYTPLAGSTFEWYFFPKLSKEREAIRLPGSGPVLARPPFDPEHGGGFFYCRVKHPDLPGLVLRSHHIRLIGRDRPPELGAWDLRFRQGEEGKLFLDVQDDYTPRESLLLEAPAETRLFRLEQDQYNPVLFHVQPRDSTALGTDTVTVSATDEAGNRTEAKVAVTFLPAENQPPQILLTEVHMSNYNDIVPSCRPGTPGCQGFYFFVANTAMSHFVSDDRDNWNALYYRVLEMDSVTGRFRDNENAAITFNDSGIEMDMVTSAIYVHSDTTFTVTLKVSDREGGTSQRKVTFIAKGGIDSPANLPPTVSPIPAQSAVRGTVRFPLLDLAPYASDDYVADSLIGWRGGKSRGFRVFVGVDGRAEAFPLFPDSVYSDSVTFYAFEKTNTLRETEVKVFFSVVDGPAISGRVTVDSLPLAGVSLSGFPNPVSTDSLGGYRTRVPQGWSGTVTPVLPGHTFDPPSRSYTGVDSALAGQDYAATFVGHAISGTVRLEVGGSPLEGVELSGFPDTVVSTDEQGRYRVLVPQGWSGTVVPRHKDYAFTPASSTYADVRSDRSGEDYTAKDDPTAGLNPERDAPEFAVFPNPSGGSPVLLIQKGTFARGYLKIVDTMGRTVASVRLHPGVTEYALGTGGKAKKLPPGMYHARLYLDGRTAGTVKVMVVR